MSGKEDLFKNSINSIDPNRFLQESEEVSELSILREELERFIEETGCELHFMHSGDLGAPFALNHRLDGVFFLCPFKKFHKYPDLEVEIQNFTLNMNRGILLLELLMDNKLELYSEVELQYYKQSIDSLLELIYIWSDPNMEIKNEHIMKKRRQMHENPESFKVVTQTFKTLSEYVESLIVAKPQLDKEPVQTKQFLQKYTNHFRKDGEEFWNQFNPNELGRLAKYYNQFINLIELLPENLLVEKGEVVRIVRKIQNFYKVGLDINPCYCVVDTQEIEDILIMLKDLQNYK